MSAGGGQVRTRFKRCACPTCAEMEYQPITRRTVAEKSAMFTGKGKNSPRSFACCENSGLGKL